LGVLVPLGASFAGGDTLSVNKAYAAVIRRCRPSQPFGLPQWSVTETLII